MAPSESDPCPQDIMVYNAEQQDAPFSHDQQLVYSAEQQDAPFPHEQHDMSEEPTVVVELESVLGKWSVGSSGHHFGRCKPCAFFWKSGCKDGQACQFCHSCPGDEKKKRTKQKQAWRRAVKATRATLRYGLF